LASREQWASAASIVIAALRQRDLRHITSLCNIAMQLPPVAKVAQLARLNGPSPVLVVLVVLVVSLAPRLLRAHDVGAAGLQLFKVPGGF
jgi:hypothetical protein